METELALTVKSLRMGDVFERDVLDQWPLAGPEDESSSSQSDPGPATKWAFAVFGTGLESALPLLGLIYPLTDESDHQPSAAAVDLIVDPETNWYQMSRERMNQLFLVICRDDERRGWRTKGMRLHRREFICCDNDKPKEKGVLVMQMEWDGKDEVLQTIGTTAKVHEIRVEAEAALAKAYEMAEDWD